ncbi:MAG: polynucleotide adenylyltransferase PcnB, partial [Pseudomonadota bacterium]
MIRKLLHRVFKRKPSASVSASTASGTRLHIIPRKQHGISRNHISPCALKVTSDLQQAGYSAFVVGGRADGYVEGILGPGA